jgi:aspartyl-tRNA synthetase
MNRRGAGTVGKADVGQRVRLEAWVQRRRDHGGLVFFDLRDRSGVVQVVVRPESQPRAGAALAAARAE